MYVCVYIYIYINMEASDLLDMESGANGDASMPKVGAVLPGVLEPIPYYSILYIIYYILYATCYIRYTIHYMLYAIYTIYYMLHITINK